MLTSLIVLRDIEQAVHNEITHILNEKELSMDALTNDMTLNAAIGITSLELARLVSVLDDKFGVDPFMELIPITSIRTIGDLMHAYQQALEHACCAETV